METIELTGTVNDHNQIQVDQELSIKAQTRVLLTVRYETNDAEVEEQMQVARRVMSEDKGLLRRLAE